MKLALALVVALIGCGNVDPPIKTEAEADGGCWQVQECPTGVADLSTGTGPADLCPGSNGSPGAIAGTTCIVGHSGGLTCWAGNSTLSFYFVSSCAECETLSRCQ